MTRIAIVGAGPGGLLAALVLQNHGIDVTVYDADASVDARDPGGTLDLHADTGQIALEDAGLLDELMTLVRPEGQAKQRVDPSGTVLSSYVPDDGDVAAPEIDRGQLRALIAAHVDPARVRWGHRLVAAEPSGDGTHRLRFADRPGVEVDLVIGADGVRSRVRPLLTTQEAVYSGVSFLDVRYDDVESRHPEIAALVGDGHLFANGGQGRAIIAQRNSNGRVRGYVAMSTRPDWASQAHVDVADHAAVRAYLLEQFQGWAPSLLRLLTDSESYVDRGIWVMPTPLGWPGTAGVTLLGDAAHAMSPFGGHGVNLALLDGAELAHAIVEAPTLDAAVTRYERGMLARADELAPLANDALGAFFGLAGAGPDDAPDHAAEHDRYREAAADYRLHRPAPAPAAAVDGRSPAVDGTWSVTYRAGGGEKTVDLVLTTSGDRVTGTFDGATLRDGHLDGTSVRFAARLRSPFPMTMTCTAAIEAGTMSGEAKVPMATFPFTGTRAA